MSTSYSTFDNTFRLSDPLIPVVQITPYAKDIVIQPRTMATLLAINDAVER